MNDPTQTKPLHLCAKHVTDEDIRAVATRIRGTTMAASGDVLLGLLVQGVEAGAAMPPSPAAELEPEPEPELAGSEQGVPWPADLAIATCLRVMAQDLEDGTAECFSPSSAPVEALEEGGPHSPHTEEGFRAWLDYFGGLSSEKIAAAVAKVRRAGGG